MVRKIVRLTKQANKEIKKFPQNVQAKIKATLDLLERDGKLTEPYGKKLSDNLFEIRIRFRGQWRIMYAYFEQEYILILSAFQKKTKSTPIKEITKALSRIRRINDE